MELYSSECKHQCRQVCKQSRHLHFNVSRGPWGGTSRECVLTHDYPELCGSMEETIWKLYLMVSNPVYIACKVTVYINWNSASLYSAVLSPHLQYLNSSFDYFGDFFLNRCKPKSQNIMCRHFDLRNIQNTKLVDVLILSCGCYNNRGGIRTEMDCGCKKEGSFHGYHMQILYYT